MKVLHYIYGFLGNCEKDQESIIQFLIKNKIDTKGLQGILKNDSCYLVNQATYIGKWTKEEVDKLRKPFIIINHDSPIQNTTTKL